MAPAAASFSVWERKKKKTTVEVMRKVPWWSRLETRTFAGGPILSEPLSGFHTQVISRELVRLYSLSASLACLGTGYLSIHLGKHRSEPWQIPPEQIEVHNGAPP